MHGPIYIELCIVSKYHWFIEQDTCHSEYPELALSPDFVLMQQKRQQHEQSPVMDHPPDVNVALHPIQVAREPVNALRH